VPSSAGLPGVRDECSTNLRNVGNRSANDVTSHCRRPGTSAAEKLLITVYREA
jgi:hypothetical protein